MAVQTIAKTHNDKLLIACRDLFLEDPGLSIDNAARTLSERFRNQGLVKDEISRIRLEVRNRIRSASGVASRLSRPERAPFNPPHHAPEQRKKEPEQKPAEVIPMRPKPQTHPRAPEAKKERIKFLSDWVMTHPHARISDAVAALKKEFGTALSTRYVADTLKVARELTGLEGSAPTTPPTVFHLAQIAKQLREHGIRRIDILPDGRYTVEYTNPEE